MVIHSHYALRIRNFSVLATYPCKNGDMDKLIIKGQGKTDYFPELQAEISAQTYCRMAFSISRQGGFLKIQGRSNTKERTKV